MRLTGLDLTKAQKALLAWTAGFMLLAEGIKRIHIGGRLATLIGFIELFLAIATGIAFGIAATAQGE